MADKTGQGCMARGEDYPKLHLPSSAPIAAVAALPLAAQAAPAARLKGTIEKAFCLSSHQKELSWRSELRS